MATIAAVRHANPGVDFGHVGRDAAVTSDPRFDLSDCFVADIAPLGLDHTPAVQVEWIDDIEEVVLQQPPSPEHLGTANASLVAALSAIVLETMHYSPRRPHSFDSWLPECFIEDAQRALELATGRRIPEVRR